MNFLKPPINTAMQLSVSSQKSPVTLFQNLSNQKYSSPCQNLNDDNQNSYNQKMSKNSGKILNYDDIKNQGWLNCLSNNGKNSYNKYSGRVCNLYQNSYGNSEQSKNSNNIKYIKSFENDSPYTQVGLRGERSNPFYQVQLISPSVDGKKENNYQSPIIPKNNDPVRKPFQVLYDASKIEDEKEENDEIVQRGEGNDEHPDDNMEVEEQQNQNLQKFKIKQNIPFSLKLQQVQIKKQGSSGKSDKSLANKKSLRF